MVATSIFVWKKTVAMKRIPIKISLYTNDRFKTPRISSSFVMEIKVLQLWKRFLFCPRNLQLLANNDKLFAK